MAATYSTPAKRTGLSSLAPKRSHSRNSSTPTSLPGILPAAAKRFKAAISLEARHRIKPPLASVSSIPPKKPTAYDAPRSPRIQSDAKKTSDESEMDVSRVDPEDVLLDYSNIEVGDADNSAEVDESILKGLDHSKEDKVMVSIRILPTTSPSAWSHASAPQPKIKLLTEHAKSTQPQEFYFNEILTGSANKPVYQRVARSHVSAAMDGYNAVIFAYGQTASGKTFTLSGEDDQPGIIPLAMKDVFSIIRQTPAREYLLRCSYLEIYNESIHDLLSPTTSSLAPVQLSGTGQNVILSPLREEVVTSLKSIREVFERGNGNRRTASTDWNERSSRSHTVFRLVIESRERGSGGGEEQGRATPSGRQTPGPHHGSKLQARGGRSVQTSVLSLIDLAGSEKATSDKDRTREGKYINTSLLTLGTVIGTLAENAARNKTDHVPFRNSKLTRLLQPSLSGNARISVVCTINPNIEAISETMSTLLFATRIKRVQLNAVKKEIVDTDALIERYRKEIEDLKRRLAEREAVTEFGGSSGKVASIRGRRLSMREQLDESRAMKDLNGRIQQLTKLILTSQTVDEGKGDESRSSSPVKVDFDMTPYQLHQELLAARCQIDSQANQILSLEAALLARPPFPSDTPDSEKGRIIAEQAKTIQELEIVIGKYEENLGGVPKSAEDAEKQWIDKVATERSKREEAEMWAQEVVRAMEKERKARMKLEEERRALATFVSKFDSLEFPPLPPSSSSPRPSIMNKQPLKLPLPPIEEGNDESLSPFPSTQSSPVKMALNQQPSLLEEDYSWGAIEDLSFELDTSLASISDSGKEKMPSGGKREVFAEKENLIPS